MKHMSTLALCELLTEVVAELDARDQGADGDGIEFQDRGIITSLGDLRHAADGWHFVWHSEVAAEIALRDRGQQHAPA